MELRSATVDDLAYVETLLQRNDLPHEDVASKPACFYVASVQGEPVGIGGLETFDDAGLLRSLVIEERARGAGYGTELCDELEAAAATDGLEALFLLTTTARNFFAERGYEVIERESAPRSVRETTEFADLCPDAAVPMRKQLG